MIDRGTDSRSKSSVLLCKVDSPEVMHALLGVNDIKSQFNLFLPSSLNLRIGNKEYSWIELFLTSLAL